MSRIAAYLAKHGLASPEIEWIQSHLRTDKKADFPTRFMWNALPYSYYAYGIYHGARQAKLLKIPRISVIEYGVAGGNGLVAMESYAKRCETIFGIEIEVYGFDTGEGMTPPQDYRDMPYRFAQGNYKMDVPKLEARLERAKLVLGDVKTTVPEFYAKHDPAPIAFASFDMDYYSSTVEAFRMFGETQPQERFLPRIQLYFDDVVGTEISSYNEFVGELAAIKDFNAANKTVKIAQSQVFKARTVNFEWYHQIYLMHRFEHPRYGDYISTARPTSLRLRK